MRLQNDRASASLTILGTGTSQGIPVIGCVCLVCTSGDQRDQRLRTSAMIRQGETAILIDIGPDFRQQMLRHDLKRVDAVLLTHEHSDHISGLDDIRPLNFLQQEEIPVYGLPRVLDAVRRRFDYIFDPDYTYPGLPRIALRALNPGPVEIAGIQLEVIEVMHGDLSVLGFRIGSLCYITDAKTIAGAQMEKLNGLDTLVLNALHQKPHFSHLNLREALDLIGEIAPRKAFLTHLSHDMGRHADVESTLPAQVRLAFDGLVITSGD